MSLQGALKITDDRSHALDLAIQSFGLLAQLTFLLFHKNQFLAQLARIGMLSMHPIGQSSQSHGGQILRDGDDENTYDNPEIASHRSHRAAGFRWQPL